MKTNPKMWLREEHTGYHRGMGAIHIFYLAMVAQVPSPSVEDVAKLSSAIDRDGYNAIIAILVVALLGLFIWKEIQVRGLIKDAQKQTESSHAKVVTLVEDQTAALTKHTLVAERTEAAIHLFLNHVAKESPYGKPPR